jgi:hypothetical protein
MAAFSSIALGVGLGIAAAGTYVQYDASQDQRAAAQQSIGIQQRQESLRRKQMKLEADRRRREVVRNAVQQRAYALASTTATGAAGSSAQEGAFGQVSSRAATNIAGINANEAAGEKMFGLNQDLLGSYRAAADATANAALGTGMTTLGNALITNAEPIGRIGSQAAASFGYRR